MSASTTVAPRPSRPQRRTITAEAMGYRGYLLAGAGVIALFFGGFGGWAATAPLASAAIGHGPIVVGTMRKTVQHLEGGIVAQILVREGDMVEQDQPLLVLDDTQARASLGVLRARLQAATARQARAIAESKGATTIVFPGWLEAEMTADPSSAEAIAVQERLFGTRREAIESQTAILRRRIAQYREEIAGLKAGLVADGKQADLIRQELADVRELVDKGLERRTRLRALERGAADIEGTRARNTSSIARAQQSIAESELRILDLKTRQSNEVATELRDTTAEIADTAERIVAARDVLARTIIRAPVAGTVMNMQIFTAGGVVGQRQPVLDIVPAGDDLVIQAQIDPNDIDVVHPGQKAQIRLLAYSPRTTPEVTGTVETVSADRLVNEKTGQGYYTARVKMDADSVAKLSHITLYPGMQTEVIMAGAERTLLSYLVRPMSGVFARSLRQE